MTQKIILSLFIIIFSIANLNFLYADDEASQVSYVVSAQSGRYYFKMFADPNDRDNRKKGKGVMYAVTDTSVDKVVWTTEGWYSHSVYPSYDGQYLVVIGNWPRGYELSKDHLGIAFYNQGKLIKSYSTKDLIKNPSAIKPSVSHYQFVDQIGGFDSYSEKFRLKCVDGTQYTFDARTGAILQGK